MPTMSALVEAARPPIAAVAGRDHEARCALPAVAGRAAAPRCARRVVAVALSTALGLAGMPLPVQAASEVRCESHGMRHAFCSTGRHGDVRLLNSSGFWPCTRGETWGTESDGIWVDQGCKGVFRVDDASGNSKSDRNAAIGAVVAVGLLAVLAGNGARHDEGAHGAGPPPWLVGSFNGYNPRYRVPTTLSVGANGRVTGGAAGSTVHGRWTDGDVIQFDDGIRSQVSRTDRGFRLTQLEDRSNIVDYYRD